MCHTPSSSEHKPWCADPSLSRPADECTCHITPEEQRLAMQHYIEKNYGFNLTNAQAKITEHVYDKMIRRNPDGPNPLVQEPKGKP